MKDVARWTGCGRRRRRSRYTGRHDGDGRFLPLFGQIAERHPKLKLLIDHLGVTRAVSDEAGFADLGPVLALAKHPNIAVKATGAPKVIPRRRIRIQNRPRRVAPDL